jgi:RND family efflux transporter MFP subunit
MRVIPNPSPEREREGRDTALLAGVEIGMSGDIKVTRLLRRTVILWPMLACALLTGCVERQQVSASPAAPPPKPTEVLVEHPTTARITDYEDFTGRTVATRYIEIRARVTGYLEKINFKAQEGRDVEKGAVLFEIDPRPYESEMARARANLLQAESHLKRLELDYKRIARLVESNTVTREQFDLVSGERNEGLAEVEIAKANLQAAQLNLTFTKVLSPISGRVSRTQIDVGNVVKADDTVLTTVVAIDPIYVYFEIDERTLLRIRRYAQEARDSQGSDEVPVAMGLSDEEGFPHEGTINFLDNRLDPTTGTLQVRGVFKNPDRVLSPGMFVRVRLPIGEPYQALMVAEESLGTDQGQKFVYVVDAENKAQYRRVQVGKLQNGRRVVLKGLSADEQVVVSGLQRVRPGAVVQPKMAAAAPVQRPVESSEMAEAPAGTAKETAPR